MAESNFASDSDEEDLQSGPEGGYWRERVLSEGLKEMCQRELCRAVRYHLGACMAECAFCDQCGSSNQGVGGSLGAATYCSASSTYLGTQHHRLPCAEELSL